MTDSDSQYVGYAVNQKTKNFLSRPVEWGITSVLPTIRPEPHFFASCSAV